MGLEVPEGNKFQFAPCCFWRFGKLKVVSMITGTPADWACLLLFTWIYDEFMICMGLVSEVGS